ALARRRLDSVVEEGGRPKSAGGRLMSISSLLEGLSRSPMSTQLSASSTNRKGRSAGSSPVLPGVAAFASGNSVSSLPGGARSEALVVRYRSSGDLSTLGQQEQARSPFKGGYAFSYDEVCSDRQIELIMRNR
ncbi:unnamed protein product, partial [Hapterophycus canaliculatus]